MAMAMLHGIIKKGINTTSPDLPVMASDSLARGIVYGITQDASTSGVELSG